jgi:hypothetical protein
MLGYLKNEWKGGCIERMDIEAVIQPYASWRGHASHGNTYKLKSKTDSCFFKIFPELRAKIKGAKYV